MGGRGQRESVHMPPTVAHLREFSCGNTHRTPFHSENGHGDEGGDTRPPPATRAAGLVFEDKNEDDAGHAAAAAAARSRGTPLLPGPTREVNARRTAENDEGRARTSGRKRRGVASSISLFFNPTACLRVPIVSLNSNLSAEISVYI